MISVLNRDWSANLDRNRAIRAEDVESAGMQEEYEMGREEWLQASMRLVQLMQLYYPESDTSTGTTIANRWAKHFRNIISHELLWLDLSVLLEYDVYVRRLWVLERGSFDPGVFRERVFEGVRESWFCRLMTLRNFTSTSTAKRQVPPISNSCGPAQKRVRSNRSFPSLCPICSESTHKARSCGVSTALYLVRGEEGKWVGPEGVEYCFAWNAAVCSRGEGREGCGRSHRYTLCGSGEHRARECVLRR
jgi:hypothetical protein